LYELLRSNAAKPNPSLTELDRAKVTEVSTRTPLEILGNLAAEPWLTDSSAPLETDTIKVAEALLEAF